MLILMRGRAVVARRAHNPEVLGSNPSPATKKRSPKVVAFFVSNPPLQDARRAPLLTEGHSVE